MANSMYVHRVIDLMRADRNFLLNMTMEEATDRVRSGNAKYVGEIQGQFAIACESGKTVRMARSIGRTMRYFLAKKAEGPCLYIAETMRELRTALHADGLEGQFHPTYTRTVPAHYMIQIELVGCPDPNPRYERFFNPVRNSLPSDVEMIGEQYIRSLNRAIHQWLDLLPRQAPLGVMFSGGIDSGSVLLSLHHCLLERGESPSRLKAFTLQVGSGGSDALQAHAFLKQTGLEMLWEPIRCEESDLSWRKAVHVVEDYKPLDIQSATMALALCREIRNRYPDWVYLIDGDGGDENLKDYPIEQNAELTIRSVLNNLMLYQEGWGVDAIKHSMVHTGGQSRGHVRSSLTAAHFGFQGFSPFALPQVIEVAESIPFIELTQWDHQKLYSLKGTIVSSGIKKVLGVEMPLYEKRRFQHGALTLSRFPQLFPEDEIAYRQEFQNYWNAI